MKRDALPSTSISCAFALLLWILATPASLRADEALYVKSGLAQYYLHGSDNGPGGWLMLGYGTSQISGELGLSVGTSYGTGFVSLDANLIVSPCGRCRGVSPFVFVSAGLMGEEEFGGSWYGGGGGLEWRLGQRNSLSLLGRLARHDGYEGPHMVSLAWKHSF